MKWLQLGGYHQHGCIVRSHTKHNETKPPHPVRLQGPDHRGPVTKIDNARKEKIAGPGKEIASHRKYEEAQLPESKGQLPQVDG